MERLRFAGFFAETGDFEVVLGRGRKPTNSDEVAWALEPVPRYWQRCQYRLAPSRSAGSSCLDAGRTGVRGATEYISGRGFVITALPVLATNHGAQFLCAPNGRDCFARQRCQTLRSSSKVRSPNKRDEASDRSLERVKRPRRHSGQNAKGQSLAVTWFRFGRSRRVRHSRWISGRAAARKASVRGSSVSPARD